MVTSIYKLTVKEFIEQTADDNYLPDVLEQQLEKVPGKKAKLKFYEVKFIHENELSNQDHLS